jgi:hypothetical protein
MSGHLARIWEYEDGRFMFDWLQTTGKGMTVFCTTFDDALQLWKGIRRDVLHDGVGLADSPEDIEIAHV